MSATVRAILDKLGNIKRINVKEGKIITSLGSASEVKEKIESILVNEREAITICIDEANLLIITESSLSEAVFIDIDNWQDESSFQQQLNIALSRIEFAENICCILEAKDSFLMREFSYVVDRLYEKVPEDTSIPFGVNYFKELPHQLKLLLLLGR